MERRENKNQNTHARGAAAAFVLAALLLALPFSAWAKTNGSEPAPGGIGRAPSVDARSAALIDATTGTLLYAKNPDLVLPPASLTKLITLHIVYEEIAAGRLSPDEIIDIDKHDCSPYIPYGSSIMYLHPGMKVSVRDLMLGAAVVSGNDAAYALARRIAGSNDEFSKRMNKEVHDMGLDKMVFVEPSGLSEFNLVTAKQYALFCKKYLELHPQALGELHSVKYIEFPRAEHAAPGFVPQGRIVQYNRNPLIFNYEGADGLKTGYIIEVGYNMAATAKRGDTRFIVVTLGGQGGGSRRTSDTIHLLDWAFKNFVTAHLDPGTLPSPRAWYGAKKNVALEPGSTNAVTVPASRAGELKLRLEVPSETVAPVAKGQKLGRMIYSLGGKDMGSIDLVAKEGVPKGNFFQRIFDGIERFFRTLFGKK